MDICLLETVVAVYRFRSFTEAANDRMLSPSTVSKHVSAVEKELGVQLFNRATKTSYVTLTEAGALLMDDIDSYVSEYAGILKKAQLIKSKAEKHLTLGYLAVAGSLGEDRIISAYYRTHPKIKISLIPSTSSTLIKMLASGRVDGFFTIGTYSERSNKLIIDDESLDPEKYGGIITFKSDKMYCCISDRHPLAARTELSVKDLQDETFLLNNNLEKDIYTTRSEKFIRENLMGYHHQFMDYSLKSVLYELVASGNGVILSTTYKGEEYPGCRFIPLKEWQGITQGWFVYRKDIQSRALKAFRKCAVENSIDTTEG